MNEEQQQQQQNEQSNLLQEEEGDQSQLQQSGEQQGNIEEQPSQLNEQINKEQLEQERKSYKQSARQLEQDNDLDEQIEEFLVQRKAEQNVQEREIVDQLTEQEEQYLTYLEKKLKDAESRILETEQVINNKSIRDVSELKKVEELQKQIEALIETKQKENKQVIERDVGEDVKQYLFRVVEENRKLRKERDDFEMKVLLRNKQISILIREIKNIKRVDHEIQEKAKLLEKKKEDDGKRLIKRVLQGVNSEGDDSALKRIEVIEKNKKKNIVNLPRVQRYEDKQEIDPFDFWRAEQDRQIFSASKTAPITKNKAKSLKEVLPHQELWVIEQEGGQKIIGVDDKTYTEAPNTLYSLPHRISQAGRNDNQYQQGGGGVDQMLGNGKNSDRKIYSSQNDPTFRNLNQQPEPQSFRKMY